MLRNFLLPLIAIGMIFFATSHVMTRQKQIEQSSPPYAPPASISKDSVAGAGIVEPRTENILIGSHLSGIVDKVFVRVGQKIQPGDPLFQLDVRQIESDIEVKLAELEAAQAEATRLDQMPRPEDVPPVVAQRKQAEALVSEMQDVFERQEKLRGTGASTDEQVVSSRFKLASAQATLEQKKAEEERVRAGAWEAEKLVARAKALGAQRQVEQLRTEMARSTMLAPRVNVAGIESQEFEVLQVNIRPGEYVAAASGTAFIVLGDTSRKHVRVDIDEHDIPRFNRSAPAEGIVRGETAYRYGLEFVRVEPYVVPKRSLTGDNRERVDTRVLQVLYVITEEPAEHPVYVGQQMDVFIDLTPPETPADQAVSK
ncbi:HlyD family secretion protein [Planctomicrobium sp. SH661]|uniref:HlyD family secretion protein n=1 Tax=Planctomicrobium sp. SH661 TaxID=3448124 RepID=UPI003F5B7E45